MKTGKQLKLKNMKTIKLALTLAAFAVVAMATAVEKPKMNVIPVNAERAVVLATNENPAYFEVSIKAQTVTWFITNKPANLLPTSDRFTTLKIWRMESTP
jgi:hypothetical protein